MGEFSRLDGVMSQLHRHSHFSPGPNTSPKFDPGLLRLSLMGLPFLSYLGLFGLLVGLGRFVWDWFQARRVAPQTAKSPVSSGLICLSMLMIVNCLLAENKPEAILQLFNFLPFFLLFHALSVSLHNLNLVRRITLDFVVISTLIAGGGILYFWQTGLRTTSIFSNPNVFASHLVLSLGVQLGLLLDCLVKLFSQGPQSAPSWSYREKFLIRSGVVSVSVALNLLAMMASGSRNGLGTAGVEVLVFAIATFSLLIRRNFLAALSLGLVTTGILASLKPWLKAIFPKLVQRLQPEAGHLEDPRVGIWRVAIDLIHQRPLFGWGLGGFKYLYPDHPLRSELVPSTGHAHNFWLLMGSEAGLLITVGLTLLIGLICVRGIEVLRSPHAPLSDKLLLFGYLMAFGGCACFGLLDCTFYDGRINVINWLMLACIHGMTEGMTEPASVAQIPESLAVNKL